tara:strand:- start:716 stop:1567 length:852 start_codon:yes stop_codon:yes gene_type:complete
MAKTLRTSGDYTIKTGTGASGSNAVVLDSKTTRVRGDLIVDGTNTTVNSTTLQVDDPQIILARNNSGTDVDAGIIINRSGQTGYQANNNVAFYWNEGDNVFKAVATTSDGSGTTITDTALANIRVGEPSNSSDAVTKSYADALTGQSTLVTGDDSTTITVGGSNRTLNILGGDNISTVGVEASQTLTIAVNHDLTEITSITSDASNGNLTLVTNGTGDVVINDTLTFSGAASTPTAGSVTKIYNKTVSGGGTGLFFNNSAVKSGTEDELISKSKATALAIALG